MRIINPKFEILTQDTTLGLLGVFQQIKIAGQTCYDSESSRTPLEFTEMLKRSGHGAMLEHGTIYLTTKDDTVASRYKENRFSYVHEVQQAYHRDMTYYITTNYRVLVENNWEDDLNFYMVEPTEYHEKRVTVRFTTQIAISREYNRHRVDSIADDSDSITNTSIAEQSTRYCNYSKDKYDGQVSIVKPTWVADIIRDNEEKVNVDLRSMCQSIYLGDDMQEWEALRYWLFGNLAAEYSYLNMLRLGRTAQEARTVLALDTRTELVHTAFISDWKHFFDLRALGTTGKPHPDAKLLAEPLMEEFKRLKLI